MKKNWTLHVLSHSGSAARIPPSYTVGIHRGSQSTGQGGGMPTVHHSSWEHLAAGLIAVGVDESALAGMKATWIEKAAVTFMRSFSTRQRVRQLGFTTAHVPTSAFA